MVCMPKAFRFKYLKTMKAMKMPTIPINDKIE